MGGKEKSVLCVGKGDSRGETLTVGGKRVKKRAKDM